MKESRRIVYRFFELPWHRRFNLMRDLGLTEEGEEFRDTGSWTVCFKRARELGKLHELRDAIYAQHEEIYRE